MFSFALFGQVLFERLLISTGKTRLSMVSQVVGAVLNCILDPIMIWGFFGFPAMGVAGAALATVISQVVAIAIGIYLNLTKNKDLKFRFKGYKPHFGVIKKIYAIGLPSIASQSLISLAQFMMNHILLPFGNSVAVLGAYIRLQGFALLPIFGLNNAMVPIVAYNYGAKKRDRILETVKKSLKIGNVLLITCAILLMVFYKQLLYFFNATPDMIEIGKWAFRVMPLSFFGILSVNILLASVLQALGHAFKTLLITFVHRIIVQIPVAMLLAGFGNVDYIWFSYVVAEICTFVLSLIFYKKVKKQEILTLGA
jgi:putative MATE family efflux protein